MANLLLLTFLVGGFDLKWYLPKGTAGVAGRICIADADRDGNYELYLNTYEYGYAKIIYIYELHLPNTWELDSFVPDFIDVIVWDIGDFDLDGLYDVIIHADISCPPPVVGPTVFESPDSFSYPTQEVWRDTVGYPIVSPIAVYDIDQDGIPEIVKCYGDPIPYGNECFVIYEAVGNNAYVKLFAPVSDHFAPLSTIAFGDYDLDGKTEFVLGEEYYNIYESPANNTYEQLWEDHLPLNIRDCFSVTDADGDGKLEFVVKGFDPPPPPAGIEAFIFEATSNNTYEVIKYFEFYDGYALYSGGHSEAGDVDGDGVPEIVLESCQNIYIIKSAGNDSFYVWETLPGNLTGSNVRIFDLDNNGLNEIIISGNNQTRIYEYEEDAVEEDAEHLAFDSLPSLEIYPNPFKLQTKIKFQSPKNEYVIVDVYDSKGSLVKNLLAQNLGTGTKTITWDGTDEQKRKLANGIYFVRFEADAKKINQKAILIK